MQCPFCGFDKIKVLDSRPDGSMVKRQRQCQTCGRRFSTTERINPSDLMVRKRDGRVVPFSRAKLAKGIRRAASTQQMTATQLDGFIDRMLEQVGYESDEPVITSERIGRLVLLHLSDGTDETDVVRIRFALVFLGKTTRADGFRSAADAARWMQSMYDEIHTSTTVNMLPVTIVKRHGDREPFDPIKLERSIGIASKGRGSDHQVRGLATEVAADVMTSLAGEPIVSSQQVAGRVLALLRQRDQIAYLRYASITKPFRSKEDFWLELTALGHE